MPIIWGMRQSLQFQGYGIQNVIYQRNMARSESLIREIRAQCAVLQINIQAMMKRMSEGEENEGEKNEPST